MQVNIGTIEEIYFHANREFQADDPQAGELLKETNTGLDLHVESIIRKAGLEFTDNDRFETAK